MKFGERVKNMIKSWLDIRPAQGQTFIVNENMDYKRCPEKLGWDKASSCKD